MHEIPEPMFALINKSAPDIAEFFEIDECEVEEFLARVFDRYVLWELSAQTAS